MDKIEIVLYGGVGTLMVGLLVFLVYMSANSLEYRKQRDICRCVYEKDVRYCN